MNHFSAPFEFEGSKGRRIEGSKGRRSKVVVVVVVGALAPEPSRRAQQLAVRVKRMLRALGR